MHAARLLVIGASDLPWNAILDQELAELALEWMMNPESPRVPNVSQIR